MSKQLVPRVAVPTSLGVKEFVPVLFRRGALVIHPAVGPVVDDGHYAISAFPNGRAIARFRRLLEAEGAFLELEGVTDWSKVSEKNSSNLSGSVLPILRKWKAVGR